jgi:hypothetical protein
LPLEVSVRANRTITLLVRGEEYVFGCRENLFVEAGNAQTVTIDVTDRPLQLSALDAPLRLGFEASEAFSKELEALIARMLAAFRGGEPQDVDALLARMALHADSASEFERVSEAEDWSGQLIESLTPRGAESGLSSYLQLWLRDGLRRLFTKDAVQGHITGNVPPSSRALLQVESVTGFSPRGVGIPDSFVLDVAVRSGEDSLQLTFDFVWQPGKLLASLAEEAALASLNADGGVELPRVDGSDGVGGVVDVLADGILHCPNVGSLLAGPDGLGFEGCDQRCLGELCRTALYSMWQDLLDAGRTRASIQITTGPTAKIDEQARPVGFAGTWIGKAKFGTDTSVDVAGSISAGEVD